MSKVNKNNQSESILLPTPTLTKDNNTKKETIFRSFEFFHSRVTDNINAENSFVALGFFDYFKTDFKTERIDNTTSNGLDCLYNNTNSQSSNSFPSQKMYGFCRDNSNGNNNENVFWENGSIFIISFLYFDIPYYDDTTDKYTNIYKNIEKCVNDYIETNKYKETNFQLYYSLDKADLILCIKSNRYDRAVKCIESLYDKSTFDLGNKKINLAYTYSHLVVDTNKIDYYVDETEQIDSICIKAMVSNKPINLEQIKIEEKIVFYCSKLKEKLYVDNCSNVDLVGYEILGETDCRIIARDVNLKKLLLLFKENTDHVEDLLHVKNKYYQACFVSSMTSLNIKKYSYKNVNDVVGKQKTEINSIIEKQIEKSFTDNGDKVLNELREQCDKVLSNRPRFAPYKKTLYVIANYIDSMKYNQYITNSDEPSSLGEAFKSLLNIIESENSDKIELKEIGDYINSIYAIIQSNWYSDFRTIQMADFSIVPYYSPIKLRLFYSYVVSKISDYYKLLGKDGKDFLFLIVPQNYGEVNVKQLFKEDNTKNHAKLHLIYVPEMDLYNSNNLFIMLAHEVPHFVGSNEIRSREKRFDVLCKQIINSYVFELLKNLKNKVVEIQKTNIISIESKVIISTFESMETQSIPLIVNDFVAKFKKYYFAEFKKKYTEEIKKEQSILNKAFYYHYIKELFMNTSNKYIKNEIIRVVYNKFYLLLANEKIANLTAKDYNDRIKTINYFKDAFQIVELNDPTFLDENDNSLSGSMGYLFKESYADISAILLLEIPLREYYECIKNPSKLIGEKITLSRSTVYRLFVVYMTFKNIQMSNNNTLLNKNIVSETFNKLVKDNDCNDEMKEKKQFLSNNIQSFYTSTSNKNINDNIFKFKNNFKNYTEESVCNIHELYMLSLVIEYLSDCLGKQITSLAGDIKCKSSRDRINELRKQISSENPQNATNGIDIVDIVININNIISSLDSTETPNKSDTKITIGTVSEATNELTSEITNETGSETTIDS